MKEAKVFDELTEIQKRVVVWCHDNGRSPWDAAGAGMVSRQTVSRWTIPRFNRWLTLYRDTLPARDEEEIRAALKAMVGPALRVMSDTLISGEGDAVAVRSAKWIIEGALAQLAATRDAAAASSAEDSAAVDELAAVLSLIQ